MVVLEITKGLVPAPYVCYQLYLSYFKLIFYSLSKTIIIYIQII